MPDEKEIIKKLEEQTGRIGFYYKDLVSGETMSYHADEAFMSASVIKLFVLAEAERRVAEGSLDKHMLYTVSRKECVPSCGALTYLHDGAQVTVEDMYTLMIILSDNSATNFLIDILGIEAINANIRSMGYDKTILQRKMYDWESARNGRQNYIAPEEVGDFLQRMYEGRIVSPEASADMIRIMKDQQINHKIPFFLENLPEPVEVAHKTGEDDGITNDAGIVYAPRPFIVVFAGNETNVPLYSRAIADISYDIYKDQL